jgi:hypothetical protein
MRAGVGVGASQRCEGDGTVLTMKMEIADNVNCSRAIFNATMRGGTEEVQIDVA